MGKDNESKISEMEVFHEMQGVTLSRIKKIGDVTFYPTKSFIKRMEPFFGPSSIYDADSFKDDGPYVSVTIKAQSVDDAKQKATKLFNDIQSILRFASCTFSNPEDVGITNFNASFDICYVINGTTVSKCNENKGALVLKDLDPVLIHKPTEKLLELLFKNKTNVEERILNAAILGGRAIYDGMTEMGFLQCMLSIESLLNTENDKLLSPSITNQIAQKTAFIVYDNVDNRLACDKRMRDLYNTRSKIAHGNKCVVPHDQLINALNISKTLVSQFLNNEDLQKMKTCDDLNNHFKKLTYA